VMGKARIGDVSALAVVLVRVHCHEIGMPLFDYRLSGKTEAALRHRPERWPVRLHLLSPMRASTRSPPVSAILSSCETASSGTPGSRFVGTVAKLATPKQQIRGHVL